MNQHEEVIRFVCAFSSALLWPFGRIYYQAYADYYSCLFFSSQKRCKEKYMKIPLGIKNLFLLAKQIFYCIIVASNLISSAY